MQDFSTTRLCEGLHVLRAWRLSLQQMSVVGGYQAARLQFKGILEQLDHHCVAACRKETGVYRGRELAPGVGGWARRHRGADTAKARAAQAAGSRQSSGCPRREAQAVPLGGETDNFN